MLLRVEKPQWPEITWKSSKTAYQPESGESPHFLGINPWVVDFAAFNLWSRPLGLLSCLDMLSSSGATVALLDCMDRTWAGTSWPTVRPDGTGFYPKTPFENAYLFKDIPRTLSQYGLPEEMVISALQQIDPPPDAVLITSIMTYWYPGVKKMCQIVKKTWPDTPVILGGIYATLCPEHAARSSLADLVISGPLEAQDNWYSFWQFIGLDPPEIPAHAGFRPWMDGYSSPAFAPILGSRGCPFRCEYCASNNLYPQYVSADLTSLQEYVLQQVSMGVHHFAFYDDALLYKPETWFIPFLTWIVDLKLPLRLHTPNAVHIGSLTPQLCRLMKKAGFSTIRLGLETGNFNQRLDCKLTKKQWEHGTQALLAAGFDPSAIGAYILFGLPEQNDQEVIEAINITKQFGFRPHLAQYTPIPGTSLFEKACTHSSFPLHDEPLYHNNSLWPCHPHGFSWKEHRRWKALVEAA